MMEVQNAAKSGDPDASAALDEVTRDMKLEFCAKVKKLSNKGLTSLVQKIKGFGLLFAFFG